MTSTTSTTTTTTTTADAWPTDIQLLLPLAARLLKQYARFMESDNRPLTANEARGLADALASATQPAADIITPSEAVFAFAAWLTCRSEAVTLGSTHDAAGVAELAGAFVASQGLAQPRDEYHQRLRPYPAAAPKAAPAPTTQAAAGAVDETPEALASSTPSTEYNGWREATVAWEVCRSIHEKWAKNKDAFYKTRQRDFEKHATDCRIKALSTQHSTVNV